SMSWEYDSVGNLIAKTNYQGEPRKFTYDRSTRLVAMSAGDPA
ncbi:MAG: RHS repeat protein, partial [Aestuariibacter sp.]|nr:RHS repeat protein [Aestuariibacter sp.]